MVGSRGGRRGHAVVQRDVLFCGIAAFLKSEHGFGDV